MTSKKLTILVIEGNLIAQTALKRSLKNLYDCTIESAYDLKSALLHLDTIYDIIFTDVDFPDGSVLIFTHQYHQKNPTIPIIAISMHTEDKEKLLAAGIIEVVEKPAYLHVLKRLVEIYVFSRMYG